MSKEKIDNMEAGVEIPEEEVLEAEAEATSGSEAGSEDFATDGTGEGAGDGTEGKASGDGFSEGSEGEVGAGDEGATSSDEDDPWQTKYMRLMADFQNYKKRTAKEVSDIRSSASAKVMTGILDVLDNFERAFEQGCTDEKFQEGMDNIFKQLVGVLGQSGLEEMQVVGEEFDPNFHNAGVMEETDDFESGKISGVIQKGYTLNGKVIRPPMVKVAK